MIRRARPGEAAALSALMLRSKAAWGYDAELLARCEPELTLREEELAPLRVHVSGALEGMYSLRDDFLEHLYVAPEAMRRGVGAALLAHARALARHLGVSRLRIAADPHAEAFYLRHGARRVGLVDGSLRKLPLLETDLPEAPLELELHAAEEALQLGAIALLAPGFVEHGSSGRVWSYEDTVAALRGRELLVEMEEFEAQLVSPDVAVVTYRTGRTTRSSRWIRHAGGWRVVSHRAAQ